MSTNIDEVVINPDESLSTVVETPVVIENVTPVAEEKRYEYQPTDEDGRPIGGRQVLKYRTQDELIEKLREQSVHQIRKMREQERKLRLGISDTESIDESAPRYTAPIDFKSRELSPEARAQLSVDIMDPETFDRAVSTVLEASLGGSVEDLRITMNKLQEENLNIKAQREADLFMASNPEYVKCLENGQAISGWLVRYGLAPVQSNYQKAYETLKSAGVLVTSLEVIPQVSPETVIANHTQVEEPVVPAREEIPVENQVVLETVVEEQKPATSRVPTGLSKSNSSNAGVVPAISADDIVYDVIQRDAAGRQVGDKRTFRGLAAINAMPSDEYKRRLLHESGFAKKVEKLEQEATKKRQAR